MVNRDNDPNPILKNILFLFSAGISKDSPDANPVSIIPSHGTSGYAVKNEKPGVMLIIKGRNNTEEKKIATGFAGIEMPCKRLWQKIITSPIMPIIRDGNFKSNERTIKLNPIAEITSIIINRKCISYQRAKFTKVNSRMTSQIPLFSRKALLTEILLLLLNEM